MITGVVNIYNEYEELIETNYVAADGIVYAQTKYQYQQAFPLDYTQKRQGKRKDRNNDPAWKFGENAASAKVGRRL